MIENSKRVCISLLYLVLWHGAAVHAFTLLPPLQEAKLLSGLVNKLGDPSRKVASKAGYLLSSLLQEHPAMKVVVVAEVQRFMFRQGLQERARYYGVVFLNQMILSHHASHGKVTTFTFLLGFGCVLPKDSSSTVRSSSLNSQFCVHA